MNLPHPGWLQWLESKWPRLVLWTDLVAKRIAHAVRVVTPGGRRKHKRRWAYFKLAMLPARTLRDIARGERFFPDDNPESAAVWIRSRYHDFHAAEAEFQQLVKSLAQAGIPNPSIDEAFSDVTDFLNLAVGKRLIPSPGFECVLEVRRDFIIWLDQLNYAYEIRSLFLAKRSWKKAQRHRRKQEMMLAARAAHPPIDPPPN